MNDVLFFLLRLILSFAIGQFLFFLGLVPHGPRSLCRTPYSRASCDAVFFTFGVTAIAVIWSVRL